MKILQHLLHSSVHLLKIMKRQTKNMYWTRASYISSHSHCRHSPIASSNDLLQIVPQSSSAKIFTFVPYVYNYIFRMHAIQPAHCNLLHLMTIFTIMKANQSILLAHFSVTSSFFKLNILCSISFKKFCYYSLRMRIRRARAHTHTQNIFPNLLGQ
jgi:hypothetical protein